jgi:hypothetical protein
MMRKVWNLIKVVGRKGGLRKERSLGIIFKSRRNHDTTTTASSFTEFGTERR